MNYRYSIFSLLLAVFMTGGIFSQSFTFTTPYDSAFVTEDTLFYAIPTSDIGAWGDANLTVDFNGGFYYNGQYISFYGEDGTLLGSTEYNPDVNECNEMTSSITFDATQIRKNGGYVSIGYGRDAADVAVYNQFGPAVFPIEQYVSVDRV